VKERNLISAAQRRRLNRAYLFQNGFVALVAILFLTSSLSFWLDPDQIGRTLGHVPPYDYYWNGFYLLGSLMVCIGLFGRRPGVEAAGHTLLVPGLLLNCIAAAAVLGLHNTTFLTLVFGLGAGLRAWGLVMGWQEDQR
jgi:hypothetical protein